jgi:hypothetical protein
MMKNPALCFTASSLIVLSAALLVLPEFAVTSPQQSAPAAAQTTNSPAEDTPAFHAQPPSGDLPETLAPSLFNNTVVFNAYTAAARVKKVLYQQPCYCHCDHSQGHGSLLDCFASRHGSFCGTCIKELFYSYEQTSAGKTPAQIREGIMRGDWIKVDLAKYENDLPALNAPKK